MYGSVGLPSKVKNEGLFPTYKKIMNLLDEPKPLGYSCSGVVIEVGENGGIFQVGDRVACAGAGYANHAEYNFVPKNLAVKIPTNVSFEDASYATLGAIALQGIRQADLRLGESCVVIGLGLLGQLTIQMLNVAGIKTIGLDISQQAVTLAKKSGAHFAMLSSDKAVYGIMTSYI